MAKRKRRSAVKVVKSKPRGKRLVDAGRSLKQARWMAKSTNEASRGDPACPVGAQAVIFKNSKSYTLPFEIYVNKKCRYV